MTTMIPYLEPVPLRRLVPSHLRLWRAQRGVLVGSALALAAGLTGVLFAVVTGHGRFTVDTLGTRFVSSTAAYTLLSLAIGAAAGAAPYRARWLTLVLVVAPRRLRWFAGAYLSVLLWSLAATAALVVLSLAAATAGLASTGHSVLPAVGILTHLVPVVVTSLLNVTVGYLLGAAARGVAVPLLAGYVLAPATALLHLNGVDLGRWIDPGAMTDALAGGRFGPTVATALCLWVVAPALVAVGRLHRSPVA